MEDHVPTGAAGHAPEKQSQADDTALKKHFLSILLGVNAMFSFSLGLTPRSPLTPG
jgi:hypothetical protein